MDLSVNDTIMYIIKAQIQKVMNEKDITDFDIYDSITFKGKQATKAITIIVELSDGVIYSNSTNIDIKIKAISDVNMGKDVLDLYGQEFTLKEPLVTVDNAFIQQSYSTPQVDDGFEKINNTLSAVTSIEGTFIVALNILNVKTIKIDGEKIDVINFGFDFKTNPNSQAFKSIGSRVSTVNATASFSVSFTLDSEDSTFMRKVIAISMGVSTLNMKFLVEFSLGEQDLAYNTSFKLISNSFKQDKGKIPQHSIVLAR